MPKYVTIQDIRREIKRAIAPFLPLLPPSSGAGSGDVVGPSSATDENVVLFDGTTGKLIKDSNYAISDLLGAGDVTGPAGGTQSGELALYADGTGKVIDTSDIYLTRAGGESWIRNLSDDIFRISGYADVTGGNDVYVEGGYWNVAGPAVDGGDLYLWGGRGQSGGTQGDVYIEGNTITFNGSALIYTFATYQSGIETAAVSAIDTGVPVEFPDGIAVDDVYELTTGHGIEFHNDVGFVGANLDMGTGAITNVGNVDGVDVSAHAARHHSGGADAMDHGSMAGLADDDHTHYLLIDGTRAMTGDLDMGSQNIVDAVEIQGVTSFAGGNLLVQGGSTDVAAAGDLHLQGGNATGGGTDGLLYLRDADGNNKLRISSAGTLLYDDLNMGASAITSSGNIGMSGTSTVDGRDVSVDGTKLDGIEAAADVTDATNVDAAGAVMESDFAAKGDLLSASAASTPVILTVGTNGYRLVPDSGEASGLRWLEDKFVLKTADEVVTSSTTLQNDDHLLLALTANANYMIEGYIEWQCGSSTPDIKMSFTWPTGAVARITMDGGRTGSTIQRSAWWQTSGASSGLIITTNSRHYGHFRGYIDMAATAGNLQFQFAQNTSSADHCTVKQYSWLRVIEVV